MEISKEKEKAVDLCCRDINDKIHGNINIVCSKRVQILAQKSNINNPDAFLDYSGVSGVTKFHKNLRIICMHRKTKRKIKMPLDP